MVNGTNISVTWFDEETDPTKIVTSAGNYSVTIVDNTEDCTYEKI